LSEDSSNPLNLVVIVSGRGSNLQAIIDAIESRKLNAKISHVISNKSDALALKRADTVGIENSVILSKDVAKDEFFKKLTDKVLTLMPDYIVLAGFMKILPPSFIENFENRIINIHPSLLPKYPGLHAQRQALEAKERYTGCTVHFVDEGCDTGPVILQNQIEILENDTEDTLSERLLPLEHKTLIDALKTLPNPKNLK